MIWFRRLHRLADPTICLVCRHAKSWHEHYSASEHCGVCSCRGFR